MKLYKIGILLLFIAGITTRTLELFYNSFSIVAVIHLTITVYSYQADPQNGAQADPLNGAKLTP